MIVFCWFGCAGLVGPGCAAVVCLGLIALCWFGWAWLCRAGLFGSDCVVLVWLGLIVLCWFGWAWLCCAGLVVLVWWGLIVLRWFGWALLCCAVLWSFPLRWFLVPDKFLLITERCKWRDQGFKSGEKCFPHMEIFGTNHQKEFLVLYLL